jgi:bacteriocin-like protein
MEKTMSETTMHNFKDSLEVGELRDKLSEAELQKVSGGYIGETEKNVSRGKTTS